MSEARNWRSSTQLALVNGVRGFRLLRKWGPEGAFGVTLEETYGSSTSQLATPVVTANPRHTRKVTDALLASVRKSGYQSGILSSRDDGPIRLHEEQGVRLALILLTTQPLNKYERIRALITGINAMSVEETYYWYSKCVGVSASSARKALRTLLADQ